MILRISTAHVRYIDIDLFEDVFDRQSSNGEATHILILHDFSHELIVIFFFGGVTLPKTNITQTVKN